MTESQMGCIEGVGAAMPSGYRRGSLTIAGKTYAVRAHVAAFIAAWGMTVPAGMIVRHTCDNRGCVNPLHLQIGSHKDNALDRDTRGRNGNKRKTHCKYGHEFTEANTYHHGRNARGCKACRSITESQRQR